MIPESWSRLPATLLRAGQDLLFPPCCLGCQCALSASRIPLFCSSCLDQISRLTSPLCPSCGRPWPAAGADHLCGSCQQNPPFYQRARAAVLYQEPVTGVIHRCKYQAELAGLDSLAALVHRSKAWRELHGLSGDEESTDDRAEYGSEPSSDAILRDVTTAFDYVLPVPLHPKRLRQRGFNQAQLLARAFFPQQLNKIRSDLLHRCRWTEPQTGMSGVQRRQNLRQAFAVSRPAAVQHRRILLVDDVFTTGTTVNECARVLRAAGAAEVTVFTLARVRQ